MRLRSRSIARLALGRGLFLAARAPVHSISIKDRRDPSTTHRLRFRDAPLRMTRLSGNRRMTAQPDYLIEHSLSHFPLGGLRHFEDIMLGDDGDGIAIGIEADAFA